MRDLVLTIIIFGSIPFIILRPHIGIMMWTWISLMNPHRLVWGFISDFPVAMLIAVVTLAGWLMSKENKKVPWDPIVVLIVIYLAWTAVTTVVALVPDSAVQPFQKFAKSIVMIIFTLILMRSEKRFVALIWIIVVSVEFYSTKGGIFTLMTGGKFLVWGPPGSVMMGNNELAVATLMIMPLMRYLALTTEDWRIRWALNGSVVLSFISVAGSYSRGAFVAMAVVSVVWWWKSKRRLTFGVLVVLAAVMVVPLIPAKWIDRMQSIENYEKDGSAMGRLKIWTFAINVVKDRPITGGVFGVFRGREEIYQKYNPEAKRRNVHSVYFEVLGTQGFVGMIIFLALGMTVFRTCSWIEKRTRDRPDLRKEYVFASMLKLSLVAHAVGGAFQKLSTFDLAFLLMATAAICKAIVVRKLEHAGAEDAASRLQSFRRGPAIDLGPEPALAHSGFRQA